MEMDLLLPEIPLAIEVDGITHWRPIYGDTPEEKEEKLLKKQDADARKNGLLFDAGYKVLRIKVLVNPSKARLRKLLTNVVEYLKNPKDGLTIIDF